MAKPDLQPIELRAGVLGLSAWVDGKLLGMADVKGAQVIITAMARQVEGGPLRLGEAEIEEGTPINPADHPV